MPAHTRQADFVLAGPPRELVFREPGDGDALARIRGRARGATLGTQTTGAP